MEAAMTNRLATLAYALFVLAGCTGRVPLSPPVATSAATLYGTLTDETGAVLPGVAITAVNTATRGTLNAMTDARGEYRILTNGGTYQIRAELQGFKTAEAELSVTL